MSEDVSTSRVLNYEDRKAAEGIRRVALSFFIHDDHREEFKEMMYKKADQFKKRHVDTYGKKYSKQA